MTNRREFLQIGIAAGAWPLAASAARAAGAGQAGETVPLYKVVYDTRIDESIAFGRRMRDLGVAVQAIEGDITQWWYDDLYHEWRRRPSAIAGLTAHGPLFCFEQLARDQRLKVVYRAEHRREAGSVEHEIAGPLPMLRDSSIGLAEAGDRWSVMVADLLAQCPKGRTEIIRAHMSSSSPASRAHSEPLYSWVIAPAVRA